MTEFINQHGGMQWELNINIYSAHHDIHHYVYLYRIPFNLPCRIVSKLGMYIIPLVHSLNCKVDHKKGRFQFHSSKVWCKGSTIFPYIDKNKCITIESSMFHVFFFFCKQHLITKHNFCYRVCFWRVISIHS